MGTCLELTRDSYDARHFLVLSVYQQVQSVLGFFLIIKVSYNITCTTCTGNSLQSAAGNQRSCLQSNQIFMAVIYY